MEYIHQIISIIITLIIIPILTVLGKKLASKLNKKMNQNDEESLMSSISNIILDSLKKTFALYQEKLDDGVISEEEKNEILNLAKKEVMDEMSNSLKDYIVKNHGEINEWLDTQIKTILDNLI